MIPQKITREHILKAIEEAERVGIPVDRSSDRYDLEYNQKYYPPKYIISLANKYADGEELDPSKFSGGDEANDFLQSLGFNIVSKQTDLEAGHAKKRKTRDFAPVLKEYLENTYSIKVYKEKPRAYLSFPSGAIINVRGSDQLEGNRGFYHLQEQHYNEIMNNSNRYFAVVFGGLENTFVFSKENIFTFFSEIPKTLEKGKKPKWYFDILEIEGKNYLKPRSAGASRLFDIDSYLNKWDQIEDFRIISNHSTPKKLGYSENRYNFIDLQNFLLKKMQKRADYQPIMIRTLLESGKATREEITAKIEEFDSTKQHKDLDDIPVYGVLEKHGIVRKQSNGEFILSSIELTEDQPRQLIALCNWKIDCMPLQLEELIEAFNKNKTLFGPAKFSTEESESMRTKFISDFPIERISQLELDEYVIGKPDPTIGRTNRSTFCYRLLYQLGAALSGFGVKSPLDFGIYYSKKIINMYSRMKRNTIQSKRHFML